MHTIRCFTLTATLVLLFTFAAPAAPVVSPPPATLAVPLPGAGLRTAAVRHYRMAGRVRPLLFWFGRDDVGLARITWREADDGTRGYELLVGTDPAKAPRALNKWGYVAERVHGNSGQLLALMTGSESDTYDEAAAEAGPAGDGDFRVIAGEVAQGMSTWKTTRVTATRAFSVHDVDAAIERIRRDASSAGAREQPLPEGARPGFLAALAELIEGASLAPEQRDAIGARRRAIRYVFGKDDYELTLRDAQPTTIAVKGRSVRAVRSTFEIRTAATGSRTRFIIALGRDGELAGVPVAAEWQPRWWLKVALTLEDAAAL